MISSFQPYGNFTGGVRLMVTPVGGENPGFVEQMAILTAPGPGSGKVPRVIRQARFTGYGLTPALVDKVFEDPNFNGIFIG
jgi:hypothetical protein